MSKAIWIRYFIVSLVLALATPVVTQIILAPSPTENVMDLSSIELERLGKMSEDEADKYLKSIPMKRLSGVERFKYYFTHPQYFHFYGRSVLGVFFLLFLATLIVSYLHVRNYEQS